MSIRWPIAFVLLLVPMGLVAYRRLRRQRPQPKFVADTFVLASLPSYKKVLKRSSRIRIIEATVIALMLFGVTMLIARPQAVLNNYDKERSRDTVLCLDVSGSMKKYIPIALSTLERIYKENPTDRYSIVVFGSRAVTVVPLTRDQVVLQQKIDMLREVYEKDNDPNYQFRSLPGYSSDIGEGVLASVERFDDLKTYKTRNIVLVSDLDQTGGEFDPDNTEYLDKVGLVPKNRISMFVLQPEPEFRYATSPQQIVAVSGATLYQLDQADAQQSAQKLLDQIFSQILNTRTTVAKNHADYPYVVMAGLVVLLSAWTIIVAVRWRKL